MKLRTKFQDEDFDFGEVVDGVIVECLGEHEEKLRVIATAAKGGKSTFYYSSIKKFMEDWEDAPEEPKEHWAIDQFGEPINVSGLSRIQLKKLHRLGNDFPSENATMKAIEKLRAYRRLKDKRFRFQGWEDLEAIELPIKHYNNIIGFKLEDNHDVISDLCLLFGGEE